MKKPDNWQQLPRLELLKTARKLLNWNCEQAISDAAHNKHYQDEIAPLHALADKLWDEHFGDRRRDKVIEPLRRIYVVQFGAFFSFSRLEWRTLVEDVVQSGEPHFVLPSDKELKHRPAKVKVERVDDDGVSGYYCDDVSVRIVQPLDWQLDDWQSELKAVK